MEAPSDRDAELGIIGCCLIGGAETTATAMDSVSSAAFAFDDTRSAYDIAKHLVSEGEAVNAVTMNEQWSKLGMGRLPMEIVDSQDKTPSAAALGHYSTRLLDVADRRRIFWAAYDVFNGVQDTTRTTQEVLSNAEAKLFDAATNLPKAHTAGECLNAMAEDMERRLALKGERSGIVTGLHDLDAVLDGLQPGEQTIIAARPSMGKTALGLTIMDRACLQDGIPTLFVSLEMGIKSIMRRLAAMHCRIPMNHIRRGTLTEGDAQKLTRFAIDQRKAPMIIVDAVNGATDTEIASSIRRAVRLHGIKLVIVDYLQKIRPSSKHEKKTYEIAQASGTLKNVADKCGVAMVTLAQLNRESDKGGGMPRLCDLAESSQIERDADVVALLHREKSDNEEGNQNHMRLLIAKNRDGELGCVHLAFIGEHCRFESMSRFIP